MTFIIQNWYVALGLIALGAVITLAIQHFIKLPLSDKLNIIRGWLVWAVTEAEDRLGKGTGPAKLAYVYKLFVKELPWAALLIKEEQFKELVDEALIKMREMLTNPKIAAVALTPIEGQ